MGTNALLFDFGGTLDADGKPWVDRFDALYRLAGGRVDPAGFRAAFAASDRRLSTLPGITSHDYTATARAHWQLLAADLPDGDALDLVDMTTSFVRDAQQLGRRNAQVLRDLKDDYQLAVVSNYQGNLQPCLDELGLGSVFDVVSDSHLVGARKPDRRIFDATLDALGCAPADCWMIGDSPPNDIAAARSLGMRTCWIAPDSRATADAMSDARVSRLTDLPRVLAA